MYVIGCLKKGSTWFRVNIWAFISTLFYITLYHIYIILLDIFTLFYSFIVSHLKYVLLLHQSLYKITPMVISLRIHITSELHAYKLIVQLC